MKLWKRRFEGLWFKCINRDKVPKAAQWLQDLVLSLLGPTTPLLPLHPSSVLVRELRSRKPVVQLKKEREKKPTCKIGDVC